MRWTLLLAAWALVTTQCTAQVIASQENTAQENTAAVDAARKSESAQLVRWGAKIDPDNDCVFKAEPNQLTIVVPGTPHDLSAELDRMNAPRILNEVSGDFTAAVIVDGEFEPGEANIQGRTAYNGAGLLLMQDEDTYIRLERAVLERGGVRQHYANFELRRGGRVERFGSPSDMQLDPEQSCWLRLERVGNEIRGIVRQGTKASTELEPKTIDLDADLRIGVLAVNASTKPFEAKFAGFVLEEKPAQ